MKKKIAFIFVNIIVTEIFILLACTVFRESYMRFWETLGHLGESLQYLWCMLTGKVCEAPRLNQSYVLENIHILPQSFDGFIRNVKAYFSLLVNSANLHSFGGQAGERLTVLFVVILIGIPLVIALGFILKAIYRKPNTRYDVDSVPLRVFKKISGVTYQPIKRFMQEYFERLKGNRKLKIIWLMIWLFNLNVVSIGTAFSAYYFYFAASFDFGSIYRQICMLLADMYLGLNKIPWWVLVCALLLLFNRWRHKKAREKLYRMEARNCGFINELPVVSMTCGSMGKKKTTVITDMAISQAIMFRQKALDILQKTDMKFPFFPWIAFENELKKCMEYRCVYNLATAKEWVDKKRKRFEAHGNFMWQLYGYDGARYGMTYMDELKEESIFDALKTYAQGYFVYVVQSSLIVSNFSIRTDDFLADQGNFPLWVNDFFPKGIAANSRFANILDFDVLRLGKKVLEHNERAGSFEFGVVAITEVGKERGNNLELKEVKKSTEETNQKNDLFNGWLKMCRHSATIDNYPFIKVFTDEQRPASWGADARDLCDILTITDSGEQRLAFPLYIFEETISDILFSMFLRLYTDLRFLRGDNTLLIHICKAVTSAVCKRNVRIYNRYGYCVAKIEKERGTQDGKKEKKKYFLMNKKIYSRRFSTDCFSDYFNCLAKKTNVGIMDYMAYETEKASVEELKMQNSYFINSLYKEG